MPIALSSARLPSPLAEMETLSGNSSPISELLSHPVKTLDSYDLSLARSEPPPSELRVPPDKSVDVISTPSRALTPETLPAAEATPDVDVTSDDEVMGLGLDAGEPPGGTPFAVGDLVWGTIKGHRWWPAMVSDPSTALEAFKKRHRSLLVCFFGSGATSWREPVQLRPFMELFHEMVRLSSSESFAVAVDGALNEIFRRRLLELTCFCAPPEAPMNHAGVAAGRLPIASFQPLEFLAHLGDVARDVAAVDVLQLQTLKGCAMAFGKGWRDGSPGYYPGRTTAELVDKIDLDVPPGDLGDGSEEGDPECSIGGKGPKASMGSLQKSQRIRSMAALIAGTDVDTIELSDADEVKAKKLKARKQKRKFEDEEVIVADAAAGETPETWSGRRERKKSKYLSPPYTSLGIDINSLESKGIAVVKSPRKDAETEPALNSGCRQQVQQNEDTGAPVLIKDGTSMNEILAEFFCTAINPLHLKGTRLEKMVENFFSKYRSSVYTSGTDFLYYQNQNEFSDKNAGSLVKVTLNNCSEFGTSERKLKNVKDAANSKVKIGLSADARKKKMMRNEPSESSQEGKSGGKKSEFSEPSQEYESGQTEKSKFSKPSQEGKRGRKIEFPEPSQESKSGQKEKSKPSKASLEGKSGGNKKSKLSEASHETKCGQKEKSLSGPSQGGKCERKKTKFPAPSEEIKSGEENSKLSKPSQEDKSGGKKKRKLLQPSQDIKSVQKEKSKHSKPSQKDKCGQKKKTELSVPYQECNSEQESKLSQPSGKSEHEENGLSEPSQVDNSGHEEGKPLEHSQEDKSGPGSSEFSEPPQEGKFENEESKLSEPSQEDKSGPGQSKSSESPQEGKFEKEESKLSEPSQEGKSSRKMKKSKFSVPFEVEKSAQKKKSTPAQADAPSVSLGRCIANGSQQNKSDADYYYSYPAALLLTFSPAVPLPSLNELISAFGKYGFLIESETELQKETNCARIVFAKSTDAEKAFNSADKTGVFAPPSVSYRLRYLPPIAGSPHHIPPLPLIRENLERMISTLAAASGSLDELKPDARENLVGDMEGLLKKVNTILNGDAPGT